MRVREEVEEAGDCETFGAGEGALDGGWVRREEEAGGEVGFETWVDFEGKVTVGCAAEASAASSSAEAAAAAPGHGGA